MKKVTVCRQVTLPDLLRIRRYERAPELGPKVLFFSGGTALTDISRLLKKYTHNSIHLVTPFDSGGSSAILRSAFDMPAVGDLRSRLMALADDTISGHPEVFQLFAYRLPKDEKRKELISRLNAMASGKDARVKVIKNPMRNLICNHLQMFIDAMPEKFNLKGASIGNLIIAGGYLNNNRQLDQVIFMFSKLVNVQGQVATTVNDRLHLAAKLENGETLVGQHLITGKEVSPLDSPIVDFYLAESLDSDKEATAVLQKKKRELINDAEIICYPPGSFYTSLAANLLPKGVGAVVRDNPCPKVYFPSLGNDPECIGMSLDDTIFKLIEILRKDAGEDCPANKLLNFIFIDTTNGVDLKRDTKIKLKKAGIHVIDTRLVTPQSAPYYEPQLLVSGLLSLT
ncbi:GAK system CofD-like protein [Terasakiella sp. A23]|uniref:GAK system CofD-like protein n=1 Tax=Terasakiella sp. FCG-A23 TaxID=3080561 RepID=UPI002954F7F4|nr:GAK system CofD-like protein [Terasakiella sp. A23]MDV7338229.1 GAK system CofD-like protein [Terasakiella sp. A23]